MASATTMDESRRRRRVVVGIPGAFADLKVCSYVSFSVTEVNAGLSNGPRCPKASPRPRLRSR